MVQAGLRYKQKVINAVDGNRPTRYLEIDWKRTLQQPYRTHVLFMLDNDYQSLFDKNGEANMVANIFDQATAKAKFPHLFEDKSFEAIRKENEEDFPPEGKAKPCTLARREQSPETDPGSPSQDEDEDQSPAESDEAKDLSVKRPYKETAV